MFDSLQNKVMTLPLDVQVGRVRGCGTVEGRGHKNDTIVIQWSLYKAATYLMAAGASIPSMPGVDRLRQADM